MRKDDIGPLIRSAVETGLTVTGHPISAKVAGPLLTRFMTSAADWLGERNRHKFESWLHEIAATNEYASAEETINHIEESIDAPWAHGPLEDAVRAIRDGIDEAALVYLAKLAAWQLRDRQPPDRRSRRAVKLLVDCDAGIVQALGELTEHLASGWLKRGIGDVSRIALCRSDGKALIQPLVRGDSQRWEPHPLFRELLAMLRAHQFASDDYYQKPGPDPFDGSLHMRRAEAEYLVRLFHGSAAAHAFPK